MERRIGLGATLAILLGVHANAGATEPWGDEGQRERMVIHLALCDKTGLDPTTRVAAQDHAARILGTALIAVEWIDSAGTIGPATFLPDSLEGCQLPASETHLIVVIVPESPGGGSLDRLGFVQPEARPLKRAYVLHDAVSAFVRKHRPARNRESDLGVILGHVIAHELGHLLTEEAGHAPDGIMKTAWGYQQGVEALGGLLRFSRRQAERMRALVAITSD